MLKRYLHDQVLQDLERKMVFVGGPRQIGKTTLARQLLAKKIGYMNWDLPADRERILKYRLPDSELWIFDEIHKYRKWRNFLKGLYDTQGDEHRILVTGSARLDYYRFGGDSLQGRYHYLRMHPLSFAELEASGPKDLLDLMKFGGFPEPFFSQSENQANRWSAEYRSRLIREDLTDLERVSDLGQMELLLMRLPDLVGSPLSINSLREDLQLNHKTVTRWIEILERLYAVFRIAPMGAPKLRAVKKEQKHYHFDWNLIRNSGARFENLIACHLLKWVHFQQDTKGADLELRYFRDVDGREVDFVIMERNKPILFIEVKTDDEDPSKGLRYLCERFPKTKAWQISLKGTDDYLSKDGIRVAPASLFLKDLT